MPKQPPIHRPHGNSRRPKHTPQSSQEQRTREKFYKTARWLRTREAKLRRDPLCQACQVEGRHTAAHHVDHRRAIADGGAATEDDNLVSLCQPCHSRKTMLERNGKAAPAVAASAPREFVIA